MYNQVFKYEQREGRRTRRHTLFLNLVRHLLAQQGLHKKVLIVEHRKGKIKEAHHA
jgi:primosomal protein N''